MISTVAGVIMAFVAGYKGGWIDGMLSTVTGIVLVVPSFPLLIALSAYTKNVGIVEVGLMLAVFSWPFAAKHDPVAGAQPAVAARTSSWRG